MIRIIWWSTCNNDDVERWVWVSSYTFISLSAICFSRCDVGGKKWIINFSFTIRKHLSSIASLSCRVVSFLLSMRYWALNVISFHGRVELRSNFKISLLFFFSFRKRGHKFWEIVRVNWCVNARNWGEVQSILIFIFFRKAAETHHVVEKRSSDLHCSIIIKSQCV